ncbi:DNA-binding transcriptional regulator, MocR family / aminotransferase domain [hydrothermal vent metagenome]|uniref:DNA-binding transcriptional regulator, MocR family / aminotransferase domain n=1 Tax=hydrothermal vent metagenome TaxID=652676 RepID=A0A3B1A9G7_9ZZZZ
MSKSEFLYDAIAQELTQAIDQGTYSVGTRMPSLRQLCEQYHVSMTTAQQVYSVLEDASLIATRPRSGYYVRSRAKEFDTQPAASQPIDTPMDAPYRQDSVSLYEDFYADNIYQFGAIGSPAEELIPDRTIARHITKALKEFPSQSCQYDTPMGNLELRQQIVNRMYDAGCRAKAENIIITQGCQGALALALQAITTKGDTVAVESPIYPGVGQLLCQLELKVLEIPTHPRDGADLGALTRLIKRQTNNVKACILIPNCQNPLGGSMPEENKRHLIKILSNAGIPLIEDDAMGDLIYKRPRPKAAKSYDSEGNVLYCSSFSKVLGPGHRIGWIEPGKYYDKVIRNKAVSTLMNPSYIQHAFKEFLKAGSYIRTVNKATTVYLARMTQLRRWVYEYFPKGIRYTNPQGGYFLWIELPSSVDAKMLTTMALKKKIGIGLGSWFSPNELYTNHIRLCCTDSKMERMRIATQALGMMAHEILQQGRPK